jgi:glycosyltransferase involved in cell wall biosynthesis
MLLLDALYINNSGGKVLLNQLVKALHESKVPIFYLLDSRCEGQYEYLDENRVLFLKPSLSNRKIFYKEREDDFTNVLCFGNIPPPVRLRAKVYTYFHNVNLIVSPAEIGIVSRIKLWLKGQFIFRMRNHTSSWLVQTSYTKDLLIHHWKVPAERIQEFPFFEVPHVEFEIEKERAFYYISNGNPHKNHSRLLDAWEILYQEGMEIPLYVTVTEAYPKLLEQIQELKDRGIPIFNLGWTNPLDLYRSKQWMIYPSLAESFGLGLVEAASLNTFILAADLPYAHAVVEASASFNPRDPNLIALAVKKALKGNLVHAKPTIHNQLNSLVRLIS